MKSLEIHLQSLIIGSVSGSVLTALAVIFMALITKTDNSLMKMGLDTCKKDQPIYLTRAGEYLHLKCNGHREDGSPTGGNK